MLLFFFISGLLLNLEKYSTYKSFVVSRIKQLYIPYFVLYSLLYIYWLAVEKTFRSCSIPELDAFLGLFWGTNNSYWIYPGGVMWFVIALFSLELIVFPVLKWCKSWYLRLGILGFLAICGLLLSKYHLFILPFSLPNALLALPFFVIGYLGRKPLLLESNFFMGSKLRIFYMLIPLVAFTCWQYTWICDLGVQTDVSYLTHPHFYWFYTVTFIEIGLWLCLSMLIGKNGFLEFLGKNTLPILAFHPPISRVLIYIGGFLLGLSKSDFHEDVFISGCLTIVVLLCCWPFIILWNMLNPRIVSFVFRKK